MVGKSNQLFVARIEAKCCNRVIAGKSHELCEPTQDADNGVCILSLFDSGFLVTNCQSCAKLWAKFDYNLSHVRYMGGGKCFPLRRDNLGPRKEIRMSPRKVYYEEAVSILQDLLSQIDSGYSRQDAERDYGKNPIDAWKLIERQILDEDEDAWDHCSVVSDHVQNLRGVKLG